MAAIAIETYCSSSREQNQGFYCNPSTRKHHMLCLWCRPNLL
uniref:Uncharacterized protein n=1 Tax=Anguilla anguilla TaxID=7936 RepID=A0A0E9TQD5_ANGAN